MAWALCLAAGLAAGAGASAAAPAALPGITILCKPLGLEFQTPKGWRLAAESTEEELLLYGHSKKTTPILRVRVFSGRRSPIERLPEMARVLSGAEGQVKTIAADRWSHEGRSFQTARATVKDGAAEYVALFTLVDQPKKVQHGFWLYGKTKDVEKQWSAVQLSIASARSVGSLGKPEGRTETPKRKEEPQAAVWTDDKTGLVLQKWPAGFALDESSKDALTGTGLVLQPTDRRAHKSTMFRVRASLDTPKDSATKASEALEAQLAGDSSVLGTSTVSLRVAGQGATKHRWTRSGDGGPFLHETYFVQKESTLLTIEFVANQGWAQARSRRTLMRDFLAGIRL